MTIDAIKKLSPPLATRLLTFDVASAGPNDDLIAAVDKGALAKIEPAL